MPQHQIALDGLKLLPNSPIVRIFNSYPTISTEVLELINNTYFLLKRS